MKFSSSKAAWIVIAVVCVSIFAPQIPGCVMANSAKRGRVVDAKTGEGMTGVFVIASAAYYAQGLVHGSTQGNPYRIVTQTDADGHFHIPSTWSSSQLSLPWLDSRERWIVTAFKPGYVIEDDLASLGKFDRYGAPTANPNSISRSPDAAWLGLYVEVTPIRLVETKMTDKDAVHYFKSTAGFGLIASDRFAPEEVALRRVAHDVYSSSICDRDPESTVDAYEGLAYTNIAYDRVKFRQKLRQLDPAGFADGYQSPKFHARSICAAINWGEMR
jgi:hypothetical protein